MNRPARMTCTRSVCQRSAPDDAADHVEFHPVTSKPSSEQPPDGRVELLSGSGRHAVSRKTVARVDRLDVVVDRLLDCLRRSAHCAALLEQVAYLKLGDQVVRLVVAVGG